MLPIHAQLFEEHRVNSIKQMLSRMLRSEIQAHSRAIEDLSAALSGLCALDIPSILTPGGALVGSSDATTTTAAASGGVAVRDSISNA